MLPVSRRHEDSVCLQLGSHQGWGDRTGLAVLDAHWAL